jgi:ABC-type Fe3+-hydroxamate transport system substrate-binding protein
MTILRRAIRALDARLLTLFVITVAVVLVAAGCASTRDTSSESKTVQMREEMVGGKKITLRTVTITNASAQEAATVAPDGALIAEQAASAAIALIKAAPGVVPVAASLDWASILAGGGALATTATTGYLALHKRAQAREAGRAKS